MRIFRALAICLAMTQAGCVDMLWWPGFESQPGVFSYAEQIPAAEVAQQVRCELAQFLRDEHTALVNDPHGIHSVSGQFLDPDKGAQVQLKLTTDLQGGVNYLGINLKGLGLGEIANLVTTTNNTPSLQLKAQVKSTQTSQADFVVPQTTNYFVTKKDPPPPGSLPVPPKKPEQTTDLNGHLVTLKPNQVALSENLRLPTEADCYHGTAKRFLEYNWFRLWLADALNTYKTNFNERGYQVSGLTFSDRVCQPKLTVATQFQLLFDISAGTSILQGVPIILPISGVNVDASPDYAHSIQIIFSLRPDPARAEACAALLGPNPPAGIRG